VSKDVISVFSRGGKISTNFLGGGAKIEKNKRLCAKTQKVTIFQNQGGGMPPAPHPNDVPGCVIGKYNISVILCYFFTRISELLIIDIHKYSILEIFM